jgi:hypothetical protein
MRRIEPGGLPLLHSPAYYLPLVPRQSILCTHYDVNKYSKTTLNVNISGQILLTGRVAH